MKKGFTLVELLAVIAILAIIVLIIAPAVIGTVNDARSSSKENSVELYARAVEQAVSLYKLNNNKKVSGLFESNEDGKMLTSKEDSTIELVINFSGNSVVCEDIMIRENGTVAIKDCIVDGILIDYKYGFDNPIGVLVQGEEYDDLPKYKVKVNNSDEYYFYLLSENDDETVNLIMDRHICEDGTINYNLDSNYCLYRWYGQGESNNYGPKSAMQVLYNATKNWTNIPDVIIDYIDENNSNSETIGYVGIRTNSETKITTIMGKNGATSTTIGNKAYPLKARLPEQRELENSGCNNWTSHSDDGTCPVSLMLNLRYYSVGNDKYSPNSANVGGTGFGIVEGYWLMASYPGVINNAKRVYYWGCLNSTNSSEIGDYRGIRPVITISKYDLKD